ncbi:molybdenum cofactor biosynthesis protein MoaE [Candidatus Methanocrinis natronophilus]|uniref:Molybdenum cofactor biosynthesis protein MoaE n=1 Tax=Candidatus Methanocrinis natronophilus TaxID=3033396 RepID=A0ABT5X594_9EURY|nr:molybdenum cofactor biosynthesis protein MoaE [Candidatus Methanocrinis natronophilus]MDF0589850.1 molybdenum cofactor biosynthesis protein MoaE [Candidatus Methanocrinis natronophilus]
MIDIIDGDFSIEEVVAGAKRPDAGALVVFLGTVRDDGIVGMEVEAYREVALPELEGIRDEAMERFHLKSVEVIHKVGTLSVGDDIVVIACAAAQRQEAFQGCLHILEEIKDRAPIWKKEINPSGHRWI